MYYSWSEVVVGNQEAAYRGILIITTTLEDMKCRLVHLVIHNGQVMRHVVRVMFVPKPTPPGEYC